MFFFGGGGGLPTKFVNVSNSALFMDNFDNFFCKLARLGNNVLNSWFLDKMVSHLVLLPDQIYASSFAVFLFQNAALRTTL